MLIYVNSLVIFLFVYLSLVLLSILIYKWLCTDYYQVLEEAVRELEKDPTPNKQVKTYIESKLKEVLILKQTPLIIKITTNIIFFPIVIHTGIKNNSKYEKILEIIRVRREIAKIGKK